LGSMPPWICCWIVAMQPSGERRRWLIGCKIRFFWHFCMYSWDSWSVPIGWIDHKAEIAHDGTNNSCWSEANFVLIAYASTLRSQTTLCHYKLREMCRSILAPSSSFYVSCSYDCNSRQLLFWISTMITTRLHISNTPYDAAGHLCSLLYFYMRKAQGKAHI
jgi:hypothetical protein